MPPDNTDPRQPYRIATAAEIPSIMAAILDNCHKMQDTIANLRFHEANLETVVLPWATVDNETEGLREMLLDTPRLAQDAETQAAAAKANADFEAARQEWNSRDDLLFRFYRVEQLIADEIAEEEGLIFCEEWDAWLANRIREFWENRPSPWAERVQAYQRKVDKCAAKLDSLRERYAAIIDNE